MASDPVRATGELTLREVADAGGGSVRLRNSLAAAELDDSVPFRTVREYLGSPASMEILRRGIRSMGRRTAMELDRMVRDLAAFDDDVVPEPMEVEMALVDLRTALGEITLRSLLKSLPHGTRLSRILASTVGSWTVSQAIADTDALRDEALRVPSIGSSTIDELRNTTRQGISKLIRDAGRSRGVHDALMNVLYGDGTGTAWRTDGHRAGPAEEARALVREVLGDVTCANAFAEAVIPVRLARLVAAPGVGELPLAEALIDRVRLGRELARTSNVGRKTIMEFVEVCVRRLSVALTLRDATEADRAAVATLLDISLDRLQALPEDLARYVPAASSSDQAGYRLSVPGDLDGLLGFMLDRIRPQDAPVVRRRFGLDGGPGETLEDIGIDLGVTRERVRQIEKRGMGGLASTAARFDLRNALDSEWAKAWDVLADGDDLVTDREFAAFRKNVSGAIRLALELLGLGLSDWLSELAHRYPHGWLARHRAREPVDEAVAAIDTIPRDQPLPRAVRELGLPGSSLDVEAALLVGRGRRVLHGYLVEGHVGTRLRRALLAHAILSRVSGTQRLPDLLQACHQAAPLDPCSSRDLTIVMSEAPHLFLEISEGLWCAIGAGGEIPAGGRRGEVDNGEEPQAEQDVTVASAIRDELERAGPQTMSALTLNPRRYLPRDRSHNSVQPTLITRPDLFARLLPGVFALWSQIPSREDVLSGHVPCLLDETQARIFAMARRADERWDTFPLWRPEAEYRLCRWAVREGSPEVRRSLLAMATVDLWPLSDEERGHWHRVCARDGRYDLLATLRHNVFAARPDLDRVLAALIDLEANGRTSWMALNRVDGRQVASQLGCGLLAVLILCGAVRMPDRDAESAWQLSHVIDGAVVGELKAMLVAELHQRGALPWSSAPGRFVSARVSEAEARAPSWVPFQRFSKLFRGSEPDIVEHPEITVEKAVEVGRGLLAQRRMAELLDWLDNQ